MPINLAKELVDLRHSICSMGRIVEERVGVALDALWQHDTDAATAVRRGDRSIDRMEVAIEEECLRVLALSHPVAADLRFVVAVLRINGDLERIADMAKGIAKRVIDLEQNHAMEPPDVLRDMAHDAGRMLADALTALESSDVTLAAKVRAADDRVDALLKDAFAWALLEIPRRIENTEAVLDVLSIARKLERIADLATNIAEDVQFLLNGAIVRHDEGSGGSRDEGIEGLRHC